MKQTSCWSLHSTLTQQISMRSQHKFLRLTCFTCACMLSSYMSYKQTGHLSMEKRFGTIFDFNVSVYIYVIHICFLLPKFPKHDIHIELLAPNILLLPIPMIPLVSGGFLLPTCGMRHHWKIELLEALKLSFLEWTLRFFGYQLTHINILSSGWVLIPSLVDSYAFCWWSNHARDLFLSISHSHQHPDGSMVVVQRLQTHIFFGVSQIFPTTRRKIMEPLWPVLLFSAVHVFIVLNVASVNSHWAQPRCGDFRVWSGDIMGM